MLKICSIFLIDYCFQFKNIHIFCAYFLIQLILIDFEWENKFKNIK